MISRLSTRSIQDLWPSRLSTRSIQGLWPFRLNTRSIQKKICMTPSCQYKVN